MPGRYSLVTIEPLIQRYGLSQTLKGLEPKLEAFPGTLLPVIVGAPPKLVRMTWGLVPAWSKDLHIAKKMINARSESLLEKRTFKQPFLHTRCIVPANGYFEWDEKKLRHHINVEGENLISMAAVYDEWKGAGGESFKTFALLTSEPKDDVVGIHDRGPVVLNRSDEADWLDPTIHDPKRLYEIIEAQLTGYRAIAAPVPSLIKNAQGGLFE